MLKPVGKIAGGAVVVTRGDAWREWAERVGLGALLILALGIVAGLAADGGASNLSVSVLGRLLIAFLLIQTASRIVCMALGRLRQPAVIGEILAGILLGPTLFGWLAPALSAAVFTPAVLPSLALAAQLGVILYMVVVGLELEPATLQDASRHGVWVSMAGIALPFALGIGLAWVLDRRFVPVDVDFLPFALFIGTAMSVTAFPVLARILADRGELRSDLGRFALACAAIGDVAAWCLLALAVGLAQARSDAALGIIGWTLAFAALSWCLVRPALRHLAAKLSPTQPVPLWALGLALVGIGLSALATDWIGVHALFGAFWFGMMLAGTRLGEALRTRLSGFVALALLPVFFALTGLRTEFGLVAGASDWGWVLLILVLAMTGKIVGTGLAARWRCRPWPEAWRLGVLMNTRGLMELVVLGVGLDLGLLSPTLFAMFVLMALVTTFSAAPLLDWLDLANRRKKP